MSSESKDLLRNILNTNPEKRFSIEEIRNHELFAKNGFKNTVKFEGFSGFYEPIVNYDVLHEMKKMGYDHEFVIKCLDANKCNAITTVYYLLNKRNLRIKPEKEGFIRRSPLQALQGERNRIKPKSKCMLIKDFIII